MCLKASRIPNGLRLCFENEAKKFTHPPFWPHTWPPLILQGKIQSTKYKVHTHIFNTSFVCVLWPRGNYVVLLYILYKRICTQADKAFSQKLYLRKEKTNSRKKVEQLYFLVCCLKGKVTNMWHLWSFDNILFWHKFRFPPYYTARFLPY